MVSSPRSHARGKAGGRFGNAVTLFRGFHLMRPAPSPGVRRGCDAISDPCADPASFPDPPERFPPPGDPDCRGSQKNQISHSM